MRTFFSRRYFLNVALTALQITWWRLGAVAGDTNGHAGYKRSSSHVTSCGVTPAIVPNRLIVKTQLRRGIAYNVVAAWRSGGGHYRSCGVLTVKFPRNVLRSYTRHYANLAQAISPKVNRLLAAAELVASICRYTRHFFDF